jgi:hypothetical protein
MQLSRMSNCSGMSKTNLTTLQPVSTEFKKPAEHLEVQTLNQEVQSEAPINLTGLGVHFDVKI